MKLSPEQKSFLLELGFTQRKRGLWFRPHPDKDNTTEFIDLRHGESCYAFHDGEATRGPSRELAALRAIRSGQVTLAEVEA